MRPIILSKKFFRRFRWSFFSFAIVVILLIFLYFFNSFFTIKEIQIEGVPEGVKLIGLEDFFRKNIIFINPVETERKIKISNPQIKNITVNKILPQTIKLNISLYEPEAVLVGGDIYFYLANDGRILFKTKRQQLSLPVIYYYQKFNEYFFSVGEWVDYKDLKMVLKLLSQLTDVGISVERVDIGGDGMIVFKIGEKKILVNSEKEEELTKYQLFQIIKRFRIEGREFKSIDLRFDKPIIKF